MKQGRVPTTMQVNRRGQLRVRERESGRGREGAIKGFAVDFAVREAADA